jgi:hypothetical protein
VEADSALGGPTRVIVLHSERTKNFEGAIVHPDRYGEMVFP